MLQPSLRPDFFEISWKMSNNCNYACPYCIINNHRDNVTQEQLQTRALQIKNLIKKIGKKTQVYLIGGEPYLWNLLNIIQIMNCEEITCFRITSNGSFPVERYIETREYVEDLEKKLILRLSLHEQIHNTPEKRKAFMDKAFYATADRINFVVNRENFHIVQELKEYSRIPVLLSKERLEGGGLPENSINLKEIKTSTFEIKSEGCDCSAGRTILRIEPNGDIKRCANTEVIGSLGRFNVENKEWYHCTRKTCTGCYSVYLKDETKVRYL